ncbi:DUF6268 family outer membrane beta-barrel protein [Gimesia maris]|uniref:DUF6268 family outer membrane beta-barrel protein n=1 Tax=Gimesia maris TaxID=122 RepID=UPI00241FC8DB|nr:DUF6268 family outer membrane beta-barrel protein [Gimesia maris]|tara:strand:- start:201763 stop:202818 length:1056 start_codon:yes stop_codon:yes gene_type:complete
MFLLRFIFIFSIIGYGLGIQQSLLAQTETPGHVFLSEPSETVLAGFLPLDRSLRVEDGLPLDEVLPPAEEPFEAESDDPSITERPLDFKSLMRPRFDSSAEWEPEVGGVGISSYDLSMKIPVYPIFGPPPPFLNFGYSFTQIDAPAALDLPQSLNEFSFGMAWMRPINEKWMARYMLNGAFASDMDNTSSTAWQIRGGMFAMYRPNETWNFAFGALATGQSDLPVLPVLGAIWQPRPSLKVDLMLPSPRISLLLSESESRQHWAYVGGGFSGGTWAYRRANGSGERLNYREFRFVLGWEATPPKKPGSFGSSGTKVNAEIGYVFGRKFEFDNNVPDIKVDNTLLLRSGISF